MINGFPSFYKSTHCSIKAIVSSFSGSFGAESMSFFNLHSNGIIVISKLSF